MSWKVAPIGRGGDLLYSQAGTPSLDLRFAENKTLTDYVSGNNLVTFSRSSTATYVDSNGLIQTATANTPRFDHDPTTGESLGLLVEEARTNYISNSTTLSPLTINLGTGVTPQVGTVTTVGPDGVSASIKRCQLDRGTGNTSSDYSGVYFSSTTPSAFYSESIWLKSNDANNYVVQFYDAGGLKGKEITVTPQWQRFTLDASTSYKDSNDTATTTPYIIISLRNDPSSGQYSTGNNNSQTADILLWGPQIEAGSFPTSYIPTTGSTVTRSADVASITGTNFSSWYNQSEGTVFADAKMSFALSQTNKFPDIYTSGTYPDRLWSFYFNNGNNDLTVGADTHSNVLETFSFSPQSFKVAQALSNTSLTYSASKDGATPLTGSLSKAITNTSSISIGGGQVGAAKHISRLTYYPVRLPDATLQTITT